MRRRRAGDDPVTRPEFQHAVHDEATWASLCHLDRVAVPGSESVKLVIDVREGARRGAATPYFLDTVRHPHHVDFCRRLDARACADFDTVMYRSPHRPFVLATLTRLPADDLAWLELWPGDDLSLDRLLDAVEVVRDACFLGEQLQVKPSSNDQQRRFGQEADAEQAARLGPLLDPGVIHRGTAYQGLTLGTASGRLRILREGPGHDEALAALTPYDVVVAEAIPLAIGPVAGLVTSVHQTPLAHVAVLSANRGTPNAAVVGAHDLAGIRALEGRWVRLEVGRSAYSLTEVPEDVARAEVGQRVAALRDAAPRLALDPRRRAPVPLSSRASLDPGVVGAKSASLARLGRRRRLRPYVVPGTTVPLGCYLDHVAQPDVAARLTALRTAAAGGTGSTTDALHELRTAITTAPVRPEVLADLRRIVAAAGTAEEVILRSSSNCEDLPGFNGAGLAESVRVPVTADDATLAGALREVWASLWSDRGYAERTAFGIDQDRAAMAVLVQRVVPHEAHVVAVTTNPVKPGPIAASFLNLLPAGDLVTDAASDAAEQLLVYDDRPVCAEVLCFAGGRRESLLPDELLEPVHRLLRTVERGVRRDAGSRDVAADVELLLLGPTHPVRLALLQARPYGTR